MIQGSRFFFAIFITATEFYFLLFNRRTHQSLHDIFARTFVVRARVTNLHTLPPIWRGHFAIAGSYALIQLFLIWCFCLAISDQQRRGREPASISVQSTNSSFAPKLLDPKKHAVSDNRFPGPGVSD